MEFVLMVILSTSSFSAEFNDLDSCESARLLFPDARTYCAPKGEDKLTAAARSARGNMFAFIKELQDGN